METQYVFLNYISFKLDQAERECIETMVREEDNFSSMYNKLVYMTITSLERRNKLLQWLIQYAQVNIFDELGYIPAGAFAVNPSAISDTRMSLVELRLSEKVKHIKPHSIRYCPTIELVSIPLNTLSIGSGSFCFCPNLKDVYILNENISIQGECFYECPRLTIHCHEGSTAESYCKEHNIRYDYNL